MRIKTIVSSAVCDFQKSARWLVKRDKRSSGIWITGLAKSGTSLVENVVSEFGYLDGARSVLRRRVKYPGMENGLVSGTFFKSFGHNMLTYRKTHTPYDKSIEDLIGTIVPIVMIRDIRDALVSRYYHILSDPNHWDYQRLMGIPEDERFKQSILVNNPVYPVSQLEYYAFWVDSWLTSKWVANVVHYEDYLANPTGFIERLAFLCSVEGVEASRLEAKLAERRVEISSIGNNLSERRKMSNGPSGTFRSGRQGEHKKFFSDPDLNSIYTALKSRYEIGV